MRRRPRHAERRRPPPDAPTLSIPLSLSLALSLSLSLYLSLSLSLSLSISLCLSLSRSLSDAQTPRRCNAPTPHRPNGSNWFSATVRAALTRRVYAPPRVFASCASSASSYLLASSGVNNVKFWCLLLALFRLPVFFSRRRASPRAFAASTLRAVRLHLTLTPPRPSARLSPQPPGRVNTPKTQSPGSLSNSPNGR